MNRPLAFICVCIIAVGLLILARCIFLTVVYGQGNLETGNFHRCVYWPERDSETGKLERCWETDWRMVSGTEGSALGQVVSMWFLGIGFVAAGRATGCVGC